MAKKKPAKRPALPTAHNLSLALPSELPDAYQSRLDAYHAEAVDLQRRIEQLQDERESLLATCDEMTVADVRAAGADLAGRKDDLEAELLEMLWRRFELRPALIDGGKQALAEAEAHYEKTLAEARQRFADAGVDETAMPAGGVNPPAARQQLDHRVKNELDVLAAEARRRAARSTLDALKTEPPAPREARAAINWRPNAQQHLAQLAGVA